MKPVLLSSAYFPTIHWMAIAIQSERLAIEYYETYPKQTYRNRCTIATSSGILNLTVPANRIDGNHTLTKNICIDSTTNWQQLHWRSILTAYNKAPYFLYYRDLFEPLFREKHTTLIDMNNEVLRLLFQALNISAPKIMHTEHFDPKPEYLDFRNLILPKQKNTASFLTETPRYIQVFEERYGYIPNLSSIDLIFNTGPDALNYLLKIRIEQE